MRRMSRLRVGAVVVAVVVVWREAPEYQDQ